MKTTLITAALCLGCIAFAAAEEETITYTTTTGIYTGNGAGNYSSFSFTLSEALFSGTASTTNAFTTASDGSESYASNTLSLTSILIVAGNSGGTITADTLVITDSSGNTVATSTGVTSSRQVNYDVFDSDEYYTRNVYTYTFSDAELTVGETYTVTFYIDGEVSSQRLMTSYNGNGTAEGGATAASLSTAGYQPGGMVITVSSVSVPEPVTATLGLLALGALALRRRRA